MRVSAGLWRQHPYTSDVQHTGLSCKNSVACMMDILCLLCSSMFVSAQCMGCPRDTAGSRVCGARVPGAVVKGAWRAGAGRCR